MKGALSWSAGTARLTDTAATPAWSEERSTSAPPGPGSQSSVTVPVDWVPTGMVLGCTVTPVSAGTVVDPLTEAVSPAEDEPRVAVTVTSGFALPAVTPK